MKAREQDCLRNLCVQRRIIAGIFIYQTLCLLFYIWMTTRRPLNGLTLVTSVVMLALTAFQWWMWTRWNAKVRAYKKVLRMADERRAAQGSLKLHKTEQLEAALAEANQNSEWLVAYPQEKE